MGIDPMYICALLLNAIEIEMQNNLCDNLRTNKIREKSFCRRENENKMKRKTKRNRWSGIFFFFRFCS